MNLVAAQYRKFYWFFNHPQIQQVISRMLPYRLCLIIPVHILLFGISYCTSFFLIYGWEYTPILIDSIGHTLIPLIIIRLAVFYYYSLFQGHWSYVSFEDMVIIIRAVLIGTISFIALGILWDRTLVSERQYVLEAILCIFLSGGVRFMVRNFRENFIQMKPLCDLERIILVGPLRHVQSLVKELIASSDSMYHPVAIVDPERIERFETARVNDIPVFPVNHIPFRHKRIRGLKSVVICWPEATREQTNWIVEKLEPLKVPYKMVPRLEDIISDKVSISDLREVEIEDLLERPPVEINTPEVQAFIHGKTVMVTGGGGSIGSELCRQIAGFGPKELVIVERSESSLHALQMELKSRFPDLRLYASISSINDGSGLVNLMRSYRVGIVFHAAAYKHVPLMEVAPVESAYNNILGTYNAAMAAIEAGVDWFVMVSSDKAVNPANIMGATKRIAEMICQGFNGSGPTRFTTVRFGNVLGSTGSVIPIFKDQIAAGGPVTVTHPDMERFFMTIPESVQLILQAGCMGNSGEVFVLDMGRPMKILDLAEKLITLSGKRPYEDIDIVITRMRPGEKLYEELFDRNERRVETHHPRILKAIPEPGGFQAMDRHIDDIRSLVMLRDEPGLRKKFKELVPGYRWERDSGRGSGLYQLKPEGDICDYRNGR